MDCGSVRGDFAMKALIIDDAMFMRMMVKNFIASFEFEEVLEASDGRMGLELYKEHRPDVVTLDLTMPEMDGLAALKRIMEFDSEAKVIVCSALGHRDFITEALKLGAKNFVTKPFREEQIVETVKGVLKI